MEHLALQVSVKGVTKCTELQEDFKRAPAKILLSVCENCIKQRLWGRAEKEVTGKKDAKNGPALSPFHH